jgi:hypothetical protein
MSDIPRFRDLSLSLKSITKAAGTPRSGDSICDGQDLPKQSPEKNDSGPPPHKSPILLVRSYPQLFGIFEKFF